MPQRTDEELQAAAAERTSAELAQRAVDAERLAIEQAHVIAVIDALLAHPDPLEWKIDGGSAYRLDTAGGSVLVVKDLDHKGKPRYAVNIQEPGGTSMHVLRGVEDGDETVPITTQLRALFEMARAATSNLGDVAGGILEALQSTATPSAAPTIPTE